MLVIFKEKSVFHSMLICQYELDRHFTWLLMYYASQTMIHLYAVATFLSWECCFSSVDKKIGAPSALSLCWHQPTVQHKQSTVKLTAAQ